MRLAQLRDFLQIVDSGSIRAAARVRGVSQPTLTKALRGLEDELGVELLQRSARGVRLTRFGRSFVVHARAVQMQLRRASDDLAQLSGSHRTTVAFGASAAGLMLVPRAVAQFIAAHPSFYLRIVEGAPGALLPLLRDHTLDFFIGPKPEGKSDQQVKTRPLFRIPLVVAGRRDHPLRKKRALAELAVAPWLMFSSTQWGDALLGQAFAAAGLPEPPALVQCESYTAAISLLGSTDLLGIIPRQQLDVPNVREALAEIPVVDAIPDLVFTSYTRADSSLTGPGLTLLRMITAEGQKLALESAASARL